MRLNLLIEDFSQELERLELEESNPLQRAHKCINLSKHTLIRLREHVVKQGFSNIIEEIDFFKKIKPVPLSMLIFYNEVYIFEAKLPKGIIQVQKKFIQKQFRTYNDFFLSHIDFGQYLERNCNHLDYFYFTRNPDNSFITGINAVYTFDPYFNTPKDYLLAQFKAYGLMIRYLKKRRLNFSSSNHVYTSHTKFKLKGTASKTAFIELTYALIASGAVRGDIKELIRAFETILDIELNDYYRTFISIRNRSSNPSKFLDQLKISLLNKIEEMDG